MFYQRTAMNTSLDSAHMPSGIELQDNLQYEHITHKTISHMETYHNI